MARSGRLIANLHDIPRSTCELGGTRCAVFRLSLLPLQYSDCCSKQEASFKQISRVPETGRNLKAVNLKLCMFDDSMLEDGIRVLPSMDFTLGFVIPLPRPSKRRYKGDCKAIPNLWSRLY